MTPISNAGTTEAQQVKTPISNAGEHEETPIKNAGLIVVMCVIMLL